MEPGDTGSTPAPSPKPEPTLEDLQREKARLEIRDLKRWWFRPSAISASATIILGILAFVSAVWIGYFDKAKLDYERAKLVSDVENMKTEKAKVESRVAELQTEALKLQSHVTDLRADKVVSETIAERRMADAEANLKTCLEANHSLDRSREEFTKANQTCAKNNQDWLDNSKKQQEEIAGLRKSIAETKDRQEKSERIAAGLRKQLSLYPPLVRESRLSYSTYDHELSGEVNGANLGGDRGTIEIRAVRRALDKKPRAPITDPVAVSSDCVKKWSTSSIDFQLLPGPRNRLAQAVKEKVPSLKNQDWPDLLYSQELDYELRVTTPDETHSDWSVLAKGTIWSTGPIRAGLPPDETEIK